MDVAADPLDLGLLFGPAAAMFLLVLAAVLTVPISFFVQMRYRRAVLRSMMDRAAAVPVAPASTKRRGSGTAAGAAGA